MKAALAKFRGRTEDFTPRVSREEAKAKEAKWLQRHNDLEAKLHALTRSKGTSEAFEAEEEPREVSNALETRRTRELEDQLRVFKAHRGP